MYAVLEMKAEESCYRMSETELEFVNFKPYLTPAVVFQVMTRKMKTRNEYE